MKTYLMVGLCLGILHTTTAQNDMAAVTNYNVAKSSETIVKANSDYRNSIDTQIMAARALKLRDLVANYDLESSEVYNPKEASTYTVHFKEGDNKVEATYDTNGNIIQCKESYKDIRLPLNVSQQLIKDHPGYYIGDVTCKVTYNAQTETKVINYKVELLTSTNRKVVRLQL